MKEVACELMIIRKEGTRTLAKIKAVAGNRRIGPTPFWRVRAGRPP